MQTPRQDITVVGAGIVGLATALALLRQHPGLSLVVVDKESRVGSHQTGHNSGVVHRGIYYVPGSLKARLCALGSDELIAYCASKGVPHRQCGKLVVAVDADEVQRLADLERRARANGVPGLRRVGPSEIQELEPTITTGLAALYSPATTIVDFSKVADALANDVQERGGEIRLGTEVEAIERRTKSNAVHLRTGDIESRHVIVCAGLQATRLAPSDIRNRLRIVPFRGDYFRLSDATAAQFRGLVYPVPDPRLPFLGVHFTKRIDGEVWAGPNAVLALSQEGYARSDFAIRDVTAMLAWPGFWRMARRHWRTGLDEFRRDYSKRRFAASLRRFLPAIASGDLLPGPSGVRAQAVTVEGELLDDFALHVTSHQIHVLNAPSPAATSSLAIGRYIADKAAEAFSIS